jgi:lipoate-protein ligase A
MRLYKLGSVSWQDSQLLYHALPRIDREGLILLSPSTPYVCLGYFQDAEQEVDMAYCRENGIPIFRREVGGGAVYLDGEQLFFQMIIHRNNPLVPAGTKLDFYRKFLAAPINAYRALGIPAEYRPVNDIVANQRKVSGTGAAEIGDYYILVGNLIVDFDYEMMARVLRVPDEKFRDKVHKTIYDNLSTIKREVEDVPPTDELWDLMADTFAEVLGPMEVQETVDEEWRAKADKLGKTFLTENWLLRKRPTRGSGRSVRIRSGVDVHHKMHKAPGGLIRATTHVEDGMITNVDISGDFFFFPEENLNDLATALEGVAASDVIATIEQFYAEEGVESPGVTPEDFGHVVG